MTKANDRQLAISAARGQAKHNGYAIAEISATDALDILDDMASSKPNLVVSKWYLAASKNQIVLFKREWNQMRVRGY